MGMQKILVRIEAAIVILAVLLSLATPIGIEIVLANARQQVGKPYVFGEAGLESFDCSGLVLYCYGKIGLCVDHYAQTIGYNPRYRRINPGQSLRKGDIVCFDTILDADLCDHVGIYAGNNQFLHASSQKGEVTLSELSGYYAQHYSWAVRILW